MVSVVVDDAAAVATAAVVVLAVDLVVELGFGQSYLQDIHDSDGYGFVVVEQVSI